MEFTAGIHEVSARRKGYSVITGSILHLKSGYIGKDLLWSSMGPVWREASFPLRYPARVIELSRHGMMINAKNDAHM